MITLDLLKHVSKTPPDNLAEILNKILPKYGINTKQRIAHFIGQTAHESGGFTSLKENLNYSAKGLCSTWPKRFPDINSANPYNRSPEKIANKVYANRMGNGPESSGDGWTFRGKGLIQLTGKENYEKFSECIGEPLSNCISYLDTLEGAVESACWFWKEHSLNKLADLNDCKAITLAINGGLLGYDDRKKLTEIVLNNL